jgi:hypothetical protein
MGCAEYLAAFDPQERIAERLDVENRSAGSVIAAHDRPWARGRCRRGGVGLNWSGRAWAPPADDRGAGVTAEVEPPLRTDGPDPATPTASSIGAEAGGAVHVPSTPSASTDAALVAPGLSVTWSVERTDRGSVFRLSGLIDPGIARVAVRIEHGGRTLASATAPAGLEDERTGTDGRPRGRARFTATLVVHGRLPASALRLDVGWGFDGAMGNATIGGSCGSSRPTASVGLRTTPEASTVKGCRETWSNGDAVP